MVDVITMYKLLIFYLNVRIWPILQLCLDGTYDMTLLICPIVAYLIVLFNICCVDKVKQSIIIF